MWLPLSLQFLAICFSQYHHFVLNVLVPQVTKNCYYMSFVVHPRLDLVKVVVGHLLFTKSSLELLFLYISYILIAQQSIYHLHCMNEKIMRKQHCKFDNCLVIGIYLGNYCILIIYFLNYRLLPSHQFVNQRHFGSGFMCPIHP